MNAKISYVIQGVSMQLGHQGLALLIKQKAKIDVTKLEPGSVIMAINNKMDKMKVLGGFGICLHYLKMPGGQKIYLDALQFLPQSLGASGFDYSKAVRTALEKRMAQTGRVRIGPLETARQLKQITQKEIRE